MSEEGVSTLYASVTAIQVRVAAKYFRRLITPFREEAIVMASQVLCEQASKVYPEGVPAIKIVASFMPNDISQLPVQEVRKALEFTVDSLPTEAFAVQDEVQFGSTRVLVESAEAQERNEKLIKVCGFKFPRNPDAPHRMRSIHTGGSRCAQRIHHRLHPRRGTVKSTACFSVPTLPSSTSNGSAK